MQGGGSGQSFFPCPSVCRTTAVFLSLLCVGAAVIECRFCGLRRHQASGAVGRSSRQTALLIVQDNEQVRLVLYV